MAGWISPVGHSLLIPALKHTLNINKNYHLTIKQDSANFKVLVHKPYYLKTIQLIISDKVLTEKTFWKFSKNLMGQKHIVGN